MNEFLENLKREATDNPVVALGVATGLLLAVGKVIEAVGHAKGSYGYAKFAKLAEKKAKKK